MSFAGFNPGTRPGNTSVRVLVTGGAGFIGSHLCRRLVEEGKDVVCLDNFLSGRPENIAPLLDAPNFSLVEQDVIEPIAGVFDQIYNLACPASPPRYQADPIHTTKTSVYGMANVLQCALGNGARVVQASTSEIYGDPQVHPQTEAYWGNVNPIGPRSCYDEGKRCAETLCFDYARLYGLDVRVARIFNTYGPNMDPQDGRVVSNFVVQALKGDDITIYGSGEQTRSFCFVDDLVEALARLMQSAVPVQVPVNLGNPHEFTVRELAEMVIRQTGSRSHIVHMPLPQDDPRQRRPDIETAERKLGWTPTVPLEKGLARTIAYFDGQLNRTSPTRVRVPA